MTSSVLVIPQNDSQNSGSHSPYCYIFIIKDTHEEDQPNEEMHGARSGKEHRVSVPSPHEIRVHHPPGTSMSDL